MEKTIGRLEDILALAKKSLTTDTVEEHNDHIFGVTTMLYLLEKMQNIVFSNS